MSTALELIQKPTLRAVLSLWLVNLWRWLRRLPRFGRLVTAAEVAVCASPKCRGCHGLGHFVANGGRAVCGCAVDRFTAANIAELIRDPTDSLRWRKGSAGERGPIPETRNPAAASNAAIERKRAAKLAARAARRGASRG